MTDTADKTLLGADFAAVCERYGAPLHCEHERGVLRLAYEGVDGGEVHGAVQLVDGVVTSLAPSIRRSQKPRTDREHSDRGMVGAPIEFVLPQLGKPVRSVALGDSQRIEFAHCVVTVHEGTVACVVSASIVPASNVPASIAPASEEGSPRASA